MDDPLVSLDDFARDVEADTETSLVGVTDPAP